MAEPPEPGFAGLLRQLRAEARLTQEELADSAGLSPRSVSDLERGVNRTARKDTAELLADALGLAEPVRPVFVAAARGRAPAAEVLAALRGQGVASPGSGAGQCPYLGLVPFEERDARLFYGRDEPVAQLARRLAELLDRPGILLVTGESGTGKSSLLRAGLLPYLATGALGPGSQTWPRRVIRPMARPLRELAMQLAGISGVDPVSAYQSLSTAPEEAPMLVEHAVRTASGRAAERPADIAGRPPRLVLVVDQFEELFTADVSVAEREAFIAALHAAAAVPAGPQSIPSALVIAAVRADFLGRLIAYPPLKAALDAGPFTVGPMGEAELRLAVTGPAAEAGLTVEPTLVEAVIAELREGTGGGLGTGGLPLMSQAMAATWGYREGSELTLRAYRRAGGVADAVNRGAQAAYDTLTSRQQDAARLVFTQLTVITPDGQLTRRRCGRADLYAPTAADIDAVIEVFSGHRLLVLGTDSVEISHDVLLYAWKQLRDWLGDDQLDRALYSQVVTDAQAWDVNNRDSSYLYRPGRLATIDAATTRWQNAPDRYPPLPMTSQAFLRAAHHAASRGTRRRRAVIAGLLALTVAAVSAAGIAIKNAASASRQHAIALSGQLATESLAADSRDPATARRLAVAAWDVFPTDQARSAMTALLTEQQQGGILVGDPGIFPNSMAFSPDGKLLAKADGQAVRLWNPVTGQAVGAPILTAARTDVGVLAVAFSPDGKLLASAGADGTVRLWNPATRRAVASFHAGPGIGRAGTSGALAVAFSPDGKLLAYAAGDGTVRLWNPATGQAVGAPIQANTGPGSGVNAVAFSPDGKVLASADTDGTVRLWNPATGRAVASLPAGAGTGAVGGLGALGVAFSPDGTLLASAGADGTVRLWNPATGRAAVPAVPADTGPGGVVFAVAFSPDGKLLASADADGTVRLWNPATGRAVGAPLVAGTGPGDVVYGVAFSPDGTLLAGADADGTVRLWNPATGRAPRAPLPAYTGIGSLTGGVFGVAFSPDGTLLASAGADSTVRLWNPATGQAVGAPLPADMTGLAMGVLAVAFSPDGKRLAGGEGDGYVRLWDPAAGREVRPPLRAEGTSITNGVTGVAFSPDSQWLEVANADGTVVRWNLATGQAVGSPIVVPGSGQVPSVNGVAFSHDGKLLASAGADGTVRLWNPATGQAVGAPLRADPGTSGGVLGVAFSHDGTLLASAGADGTVRLWNPATGQAVGAPLLAGSALLGGVRGVAFSPDGTLLASADADGTVRTWQVALFADPYRALCADVGAPATAEWNQYAPGETEPSVCG